MPRRNVSRSSTERTQTHDCRKAVITRIMVIITPVSRHQLQKIAYLENVKADTSKFINIRVIYFRQEPNLWRQGRMFD